MNSYHSDFLIPESEPLHHRLELFTGKGGVGKTTLAVTWAREAASRGYQPLIIETSPFSKLEPFFSTSLNASPKEVETHLFALRLNPRHAIRDYLAANLPFSHLANWLSKNRSLNVFLNAAPGVTEAAFLHQLIQLTKETEFHPIIVDLESSGYAFMFLSLPQVFAQIGASGPIRSLAEASQALLSDPTQTRLHVVTLPSEIPQQETVELCHQIEASPHCALGYIIMNRLKNEQISEEISCLDLQSLPPSLQLFASNQIKAIQTQRELIQSLQAQWPNRVLLYREHQKVTSVTSMKNTNVSQNNVTPLEIDSLFEKHQLIVCAGAGGVGKTTTTAALGMYSAALGYRTLILTVDPAKRLASVLGLKNLDDQCTAIVDPKLSGELHAAMVEMKASYDSLIRRIADRESQQSILGNSVYQAFSETLARSHAYVVMERLHHEIQSQSWDRIILDTPPTENALDILDAPLRLTRFLNHRILRWLLPTSSAQKSSRALSTLARVMGQQTLEELIRFLGLFANLKDGFESRAQETLAWLHSNFTGFLLVTDASPVAISETHCLLRTLTEQDITCQGLIGNRAFIPQPGTKLPITPNWVKELQEQAGGKANRLLERASDIANQNQTRCDSLQQLATEAGIPLHLVPHYPDEIHSLDHLLQHLV